MVNALIVLFVFSAPKAPSAAQEATAAYEDGLNLSRAKQFPEAAALAEKCLATDPKKAECHMLAGSSYAHLKQMEKAAQHYREFLKLAPDHPSASRVSKVLEDYDRQKAPSARGKTDEARLAYEEGRRLVKAKQFSQAVLKAEKCLAIDPAMVDCHMLAGAAYASMGQMDQGARHYREFVKQAPDHAATPKLQRILEDYDRSKGQ